MKLVHAMILNQNAASAYAARVVSEMIKSGCDAPTMRRHEIPTSVFYCVLGGSHHLKGREPSEMACDMIRTYRPDYLYNAEAGRTELARFGQESGYAASKVPMFNCCECGAPLAGPAPKEFRLYKTCKGVSESFDLCGACAAHLSHNETLDGPSLRGSSK